MSYRNSDAIIAMLRWFDENSDAASYIPLEPSFEGREIGAIRVRMGTGSRQLRRRRAVFLLGGLHGGEAMIPDILVDFVFRLLSTEDTWPIEYENEVIKLWSASAVARIRNSLDIVVLPDANPDGREWSFGDPLDDVRRLWRKNRRPDPDVAVWVGVDLNRNFPVPMPPAIGVAIDGHVHHRIVKPPESPGAPDYAGPFPLSEVESRNVQKLLEEFSFECMLDLHSPLGLVMYPWGYGLAQADNPGANAYMHPYDRAKFQSVASAAAFAMMDVGKSPITSNGIHVNDQHYDVGDVHSLYGQTFGSAIDYAHARSLEDPDLPTLYSFALDIGDKKLLLAKRFDEFGNPIGGGFGGLPDQPDPKIVETRFTPQAFNGILTILDACATGVFAPPAIKGNAKIVGIYDDDLIKPIRAEAYHPR